MHDCWVDGVLCQMARYPQIICLSMRTCSVSQIVSSFICGLQVRRGTSQPVPRRLSLAVTKMPAVMEDIRHNGGRADPDSAKATSSGILESRWWHTVNISKCSSIVLTVKGRVGLVDEVVHLIQHTLIMSGAWPPPAPSVWKASSFKGPYRVLHKSCLLGICMDSDLNIQLSGRCKYRW